MPDGAQATSPGRADLLGLLDRLLGGPALSTTRRLRTVVALFHRVGPDESAGQLLPSTFDQALALLQDAFEVVPLGDLVSRRRAGRSTRGLAAVTFDDGYRDFLTDALPVIEGRGVPVTHFVVTECVRTGVPTWNHRLQRLVSQGLAGAATKRGIGGMTRSARDAWLDARERDLVATARPPMLSAADLVTHRHHPLLTWASHTTTHASLAVCPSEEVHQELADSKTYLEELDVGAAAWVAYPNGSFDRTAARQARDAGYEAAFATGQRAWTRRSDLWALPRIDIGGGSVARARLELAGTLQPARAARSAVTRRTG